MDLLESAQILQNFQRESLSATIALFEKDFVGKDKHGCLSLGGSRAINADLLAAANRMKNAASQINVIIHAVGILTALPFLLEEDEKVESLSLGAGNTGRDYDLETNFRVAEFKFINWKGGPESIRQNGLFKDFFCLAEAETEKRRSLYLLGLEKPLKFFNGKRNILTSVCSRNAKLKNEFVRLYGDQFSVVKEYYDFRKDRVSLEDLTVLAPEVFKE